MDWVNGTVSGEVTGVVSVPEGMVEPADTLARDAKEEEGRECSHLPFEGLRGVAATVLARRNRVEKAAKLFIVVDLQGEIFLQFKMENTRIE